MNHCNSDVSPISQYEEWRQLLAVKDPMIVTRLNSITNSTDCMTQIVFTFLVMAIFTAGRTTFFHPNPHDGLLSHGDSDEEIRFN